jgi:hypothetical protein
MGKQSRRKQRARRSESRNRASPSSASTARRMFGLIAAWIGGISAVLGIVGSVIAFLPTISVDHLFMENDAAPLTSRFSVKNVGSIPIRDVTCGCVFASVNGSAVEALLNGRMEPVHAMASSRSPIADSLEPQEAATADCDIIRDLPATSDIEYDIVLVVNYHPWWLPLKRMSAFRFTNSVDATGHQHWLPRPLSKKIMSLIPQQWGGKAVVSMERLRSDIPARVRQRD